MTNLAPIFTLYRDYNDAGGVTMCIQEYGDVDFFHNEERRVTMSGAQFRKFIDLYKLHAPGSSEDEQLTQSFNMSKTYIDKDGDRWKWREVKDSDHLGEWVCYHRLDEDELSWEPIPPAVFGPYTEEEE